MKIASWNVNSLRVRLPQVLDWLASSEVDVLGLQETKTQDNDFPSQQLHDAGYDSVYSGQKTYNGVALLARRGSEIASSGPMQDTVSDLPGLEDPQRRVMAATVGGLRIVNLYVPNGSSLDSDKYIYKLNWLENLHAWLASELQSHPNMIVMGDFNIAPDDRDVHDPPSWEGKVLVSPAERAALSAITKLGFCDSFRKFEQPEKQYSWWDYRMMGFRLNHGVRIDLILASESAAHGLTASWIDKEPRGWERPSDHTPVVAEFTL